MTQSTIYIRFGDFFFLIFVLAFYYGCSHKPQISGHFHQKSFPCWQLFPILLPSSSRQPLVDCLSMWPCLSWAFQVKGAWGLF